MKGGFINGHSAAVSATGAVGIEASQAGFDYMTITGGIIIWVVCKVLDAIYIKFIETKK